MILILPIQSLTQSLQGKVHSLDSLLGIYDDYGKLNGSILVAHEGELLFKKGYGRANIEWDVPNQTDTKFRLASVSKQFTAFLVMQLVSEGKLDLEKTVKHYLPEYPNEEGGAASLHQLLTHSSGIPSYTGFANYSELMSEPVSPIELVQLFSDSTLNFQPGERFQYNNSGYALLGAIMEKVTNRSYSELLQEKIFEPLQMHNSGYDSNSDIIQNRASGYYRFGKDFQNANYIDMSRAYSAGGIYSTVEDMFIWDQSLYTDKLLPQNDIKTLFGKHIRAWGGYYGYGWALEEMQLGSSNEKVETIFHDGVINGFNTIIVRVPTTQSSIIILNNSNNVPQREIVTQILGILFDKPYDFPKKSIADVLIESIENEGIQKVLSQFDTMKASDKYYLDEREMNMMGYSLLQAGMKEDASTIFKINLESFPYSANAYDSYAESLLELGQTEEAIKNYQMSLKLNPLNENGVNALNKLGFDLKVLTKEDLFFLETNPDWYKEIFYFPLGFARDINYYGIEDARFPPGWRVKESNEFWSYVFAWKIENDRKLTKEELVDDLIKYYNGLMTVVNRTERDMSNITTVSLNESSDINTSHRGLISTYDAFIDNEMIELNVSVDQKLCEEDQTLYLIFRISPQDFEQEIWKELYAVKGNDESCHKD